MGYPKILAAMQRDDSCPEDARAFARWDSLGDEREYDKDEGWARAQEDEMYRDITGAWDDDDR